jgi:hypothetical protein
MEIRIYRSLSRDEVMVSVKKANEKQAQTARFFTLDEAEKFALGYIEKLLLGGPVAFTFSKDI